MKARKLTMIGMSVLMLLCIGLIYGWSIFVAPLEKEFGWARSQTSLTFTISMAMFCIGGLVGGALTVRKVSRTILLGIAGVLLLAGFTLASTSLELIHFYIYYGVFCGFGVGISYNVIISSVTKLFPEKQGLVSGVLMMGFGFGGLVLGSLCSQLLVSMGWRSTFKAIGLLIGLMVILGAVLLELLGKNLTSGPAPAKKAAVSQGRDLNTAQTLREPSFQIMFLWMVIVGAAGLMVIGHVAPSIMELGAEPKTAALAVGMVSVFNGLGRVAFGMSFDRLGIQKTLWIINSCLLTAGVLLALAVSNASLTLFFAGCAFMGLSYGGAPVSASALVHRLFGATYFSSNFSVAVSNLIFAALIGPPLAGWLRGASGSYQTSYVALIIFGIIALLLCWILTRRVTRYLSGTEKA